MSHHDHVYPLLGAYALHALDEDEAERVQEHLRRCSTCQAELGGLLDVACRLAELTPSHRPSRDLRGRVLASVERVARPPVQVNGTAAPARRYWPWIGALAGALAIALLAAQVWLIAHIDSLDAQLAEEQETEAVLLSSNPVAIRMQSPDPTSKVDAWLRVDPTLRQAVLTYYRMPLPGPNQYYQCWFEYADGTTVPYERMTVLPDGHGLLAFSVPDPAPSRIRVTLESGPTTAPTGPTVLAGQLSGL